MWGKEQDVIVRPEPKKRRRLFGKKFVVLAFLAILAALFFFAYSGDFSPITGNAISSGQETGQEPLSGFSMQADMQTLTNPFSLKQPLGEITITSNNANNQLLIGKDNLLDLSQLSTVSLTIKDFDGELHFDGSKVTLLEGDVSRITINGIPTSSAGGSINVKLQGELPYQNLGIEGVSMRRYSFTDRGSFSFDSGKISLNTNGETLTLENFQGNIIGTETLFSMNGRIENAKTEGTYSFELKR